MVRRNSLIAAAVACAVALAAPATAAANGDPPSDVLPIEDVYFPVTPPTSEGVAGALLELCKRVRADGWPIKVAIVATDTDLGDVPQYLVNPQGYANFLAQEIGGPRLLVVMPLGFGGQKLGPGAGALPQQQVQPGDDRLERRALDAVAQLAAADGHRVAVPAIDTSELGRRPYRGKIQVHQGQQPAAPAARTRAKSGGGTSALVYVAPVAVVLLLLGGVVVRDRRRRP
jgi:hypothetical protein